MSRPLRQLALLAAVVAAAGGGCTRSLVQHKQPPDPLLVSKKPVEGKPRTAAAPRGEATARVDPPAPPNGIARDATVAAPDPDLRRPVRLSSEVVVKPGN
jgi:hypothetical protein